MLTDLQKKILLRLARQTIEEELGQQATDPVAQEELHAQELRQHRGVFVTLNFDGMLRGCIGSLLGLEPLIAGVRRQAINAALRDNRFPLLTVDELPEVVIEISVLTPPQNLEYTDNTDLINRLQPGIDGVILKIPGVVPVRPFSRKSGSNSRNQKPFSATSASRQASPATAGSTGTSQYRPIRPVILMNKNFLKNHEGNNPVSRSHQGNYSDLSGYAGGIRSDIWRGGPDL
jgi:AmmeMemoRadiSam system protein A